MVTLNNLKQDYNNIISMGDIDNKKIYSILIINALGNCFSTLQSAIQAMTEEPGYMPDKLICHIKGEQTLNRNRACAAGLNAMGATALTATTSSASCEKNVVVCTNCKCVNHMVDFCIQPGGKMAGHTIDKAWAAQHAAANNVTESGHIGPNASITH
jgi:hypothetical protein